MPFHEQSTRAVAELSARLSVRPFPDQVMLLEAESYANRRCPSKRWCQAALGSFTPCPENFAQTSAASKQRSCPNGRNRFGIARAGAAR